MAVLGRLLVVMGMGRMCGILVLVVHVQHPAATRRQLVGVVGGGSGGRSCGGCIRGRRRTMVVRQAVLRVQAKIGGVVHAGGEMLAGQQDMGSRRRCMDGQRRRTVSCNGGMEV